MLCEAKGSNKKSGEKLERVSIQVDGKKVTTYKFPDRFHRIAATVLKQNPDIITMQELDRYEEMLEIFKSLGYDGCFQRKPKGQCMKNNGGIMDVVAIFWNTNRIAKIGREEGGPLPKGKQTVIWTNPKTGKQYECDKLYPKPEELKKLDLADGQVQVEWTSDAPEGMQKYECDENGEIVTVVKKNKAFKKKKAKTVYKENLHVKKGSGKVIPDKGKQIWFHADFKTIESGKKFTVVTGHFKSGTAEKDLPDKAAQAKFIAKELRRFHDSGNRLIFACDFNINNEDEAFKLFYDGTVPKVASGFNLYEDKHKASTFLKSVYGLKDNRYHTVNRKPPTHPSSVKWRKGGEQLEKIRNEMDIKHTIDYIFFNKWVKALDTLTIPSFKTVRKTTKGLGLPSFQYGSDHFQIGGDFKLTGTLKGDL